MIECLFDRLPFVHPGMAEFDAYQQVLAHRRALLEKTEESVGWMARIARAGRSVNQDVAAELVAIGELFAHRSVGGAESGQWAIDTFKAVAGEVAAGALRSLPAAPHRPGPGRR